MGSREGAQARTLLVRDVAEEPSVTEDVEDAKLQWPRAQDVWDTITWVLARDPEIGVPVYESGAYRAFTYEGARSGNLPTATVLYQSAALRTGRSGCRKASVSIGFGIGGFLPCSRSAIVATWIFR